MKKSNSNTLNYDVTDDEYFSWIVGLVDDETHDKHDKVLKIMYGTPFKYVVDNDVNRIEDGLNLRHIFCEDYGFELGYLTRPCSVLEVLVALACRINDDIMPDSDETAADWFWEMMRNLNLERFDDDAMHILPHSLEEVHSILTRFMFRQYVNTKSGNIFAFDKEPEDIIDTELWYQMQFYIEEKYGF